jgi:hypothetical protein
MSEGWKNRAHISGTPTEVGDKHIILKDATFTFTHPDGTKEVIKGFNLRIDMGEVSES